MRDLNYQLKSLCKQSHDGAIATQVNREKTLAMIANQLHDLGYRRMSAQSLKPKHIEALTQRWLREGLSVGAIKNRMAHLRWWAEKVNRQFVTNESKAQRLNRFYEKLFITSTWEAEP